MNAKEENSIYQIIAGDGYTTVKLNGSLAPETAKTFEGELTRLVAGPNYHHIIVNCDNLSGLATAWVRCLLLLAREVQKVNKEIRFIMVSPDLVRFFQTEGVDKAFKVCPNLRDALVDVKLVTPRKLDTDFINPFLDGTLQALKIQAQTEAKPGKLYIKTDKDKFSGDISGVIGLVSATFSGSVVISFPEATFLKLMSRMLGEEYTEITRELADGAGELTNIIFGKAKVVLNEKGYGINTALPSVITGKGHSISSMTKGPTVVLPFETDIGPFFVEICISG